VIFKRIKRQPSTHVKQIVNIQRKSKYKSTSTFKKNLIIMVPRNLFKLIITNILLITFLQINPIFATRLAEIIVVDHEIIMLHFKDGEVFRRDDGKGNCAFMGHCHNADGSRAVYYGKALDENAAGLTGSWTITSDSDPFYEEGKEPVQVYRKSKLNGMSIKGWQSSDYGYDHTMEHFIYLVLPQSMKQGQTYTIHIATQINSDTQMASITWDIFNIRSEAIHINLAGYSTRESIKSADLYHWMGSGGARDFSDSVGKQVFVYNVATGESTPAGNVSFWKNSAGEVNNYNFTRSNVWNADFTGFNEPGIYRLAIEDVGSSQDFEIADGIYYEPFRVSTLGFFYMRLGQNSPEISPRPRLPLFTPGVDNTVVHITTMHPFHPQWKTFSSGDAWDKPNDWAAYTTGETNENAWGGHSDAYDWDRHLGHVSIIWDILLPYILTNGHPANDDLGIAESGNGIPDLIDEARYEVDFFLRIRDGKGYSHGVTCPRSESNRVMYQAGTSAISAWVNALNAAMLAEAFRISGHVELMNAYSDSAQVAFHYASQLQDQMLSTKHSIGEQAVTGKDLKMMAAAYLYNVTGDVAWEDVMAENSNVSGSQSVIQNKDNFSQLWGVAAYLKTPHEINYPQLHENMRSSIIHEAKSREANYTTTRPSRRATDNTTGYFHTIQNVQRVIVAHAVATSETDRAFFENALLLEADWGLGRNPANIIQMTTASTRLGAMRSVQAAYTSGYNDGVPGLHPGHTPYWNTDDWAPGMIMGRPSWMANKSFPAPNQWPKGELFFPTDYVWSHTEFTPQQTMRGKQALYGYLYGIDSDYLPASHPEKVELNIVSEHGKVTLSPGNNTFYLNQLVTLTANPNPNYKFSHWSGDATGNENPLVITMDENKNITANYQSTVNIPTLHSDDPLTIYPNPAANKVTIKIPSQISNATIEIVDANGKSFLTEKLNGRKELLVNTESFPRGLYFIRLSFQNKTITRTMVLQ
jgi:endoglucanase